MTITPPIPLSTVLFALTLTLRRTNRAAEADGILLVANTLRGGKPDVQIHSEWEEELEEEVLDALHASGWEVEFQTDQTSHIWVISDPANQEESEYSFEFLPEQVVMVSRHPAHIQYLRSLGYVGTPIPHATAADVTGKTVIGNLPMHLACLCKKVGCADMSLPSSKCASTPTASVGTASPVTC